MLAGQRDAVTGPARHVLGNGDGVVPEEVVLKVLAMDANDLDLMLQHPSAARAQVR